MDYVDLPIENGDVPWLFVCLAEGMILMIWEIVGILNKNMKCILMPVRCSILRTIRLKD
jgi:hypothetical protein